MSTYIKDPGDRTDYVIDWAPWLNDDTITASAWTVPTGITQYAVDSDTATTTIWLTGGTHGNEYSVVNQITTDGGRIKQQSLKIIVREQ